MKKIINFLSAPKTALILIISIAVISILGTLIIQTSNPESEAIDKYPVWLYKVCYTFDLFDIYHSVGFVLLLVILSVSLIVCTYKRFRKDSVFSLSRWGTHFIHLSMLIIFLGGILGGIFGFNGFMNIIEGDQSNTVLLKGGREKINLPYSVACLSAKTEYYEERPGMPKEYLSELAILKADKIVAQKTIQVNDPLEFEGIRFFQSDLGSTGIAEKLTLTISSRSDSELEAAPQAYKESFQVEIGQEIQYQEMIVKVIDFLPDFALNEDSEAFTRSMELNNPAALISVQAVAPQAITENKEDLEKQFWVFANFPDFQHNDLNLPYQFGIEDFSMLNYTGLQVVKDPGVTVVWFGCALLMIGIWLTFFMQKGRFWMQTMKINDSKYNLVLAVSDYGSFSNLKEIFLQLTSELEKNLTTIK